MFEKDRYYAVMGEFLTALERLQKRLYSPKDLTADERRDMANALYSLLHRYPEGPLDKEELQ